MRLDATAVAVLAGLIGAEARPFSEAVPVGPPVQTTDDLDYWEHRIEAAVDEDTSIPSLEREAIIRAPRGQRTFKDRVIQIEKQCRITGSRTRSFWSHPIVSPGGIAAERGTAERENGLLLTPSIDQPFDRGFIGFENNGNLILSLVWPARSTTCNPSVKTTSALCPPVL
jgi:hypothetical protein